MLICSYKDTQWATLVDCDAPLRLYRCWGRQGWWQARTTTAAYTFSSPRTWTFSASTWFLPQETSRLTLNIHSTNKLSHLTLPSVHLPLRLLFVFPQPKLSGLKIITFCQELFVFNHCHHWPSIILCLSFLLVLSSPNTRSSAKCQQSTH